MTLYITYDNESLQDGLGAQSLRITGVYAIAKFFGLRYLHSPIKAAIEDISHGRSNSSSNSGLINFFNTFFAFPSLWPTPHKSRIIFVRSLSARYLLISLLRYKFSSENVVLKVLLPMPVLDKFPVIYFLATRQIRKINQNTLKSHRSLALVAHVRRGYDEKYANTKYATARHLPFSYFTDALKIASKQFHIAKNSGLVIHTDLVNKTTIWKPNQEGIMEGYRTNSGKSFAKSIELEGYDLNQEIEAPQEYVMQVHYCDNLDNTFLDMCTADVLLQGRSALSYLAGIININSVVWPENQTHAKLPRWYSSSDLGINLRDEMLG